MSDTNERPSAVEAARRVSAEETVITARDQQRAVDNRLRSIAANAVLGAMACYGRTIVTDDDAARMDMIERLLVLPNATGIDYQPLIATTQTAPAIDSTRLQLTVEAAIAKGAAVQQQGDTNQ